jgi:hypothetical protein
MHANNMTLLQQPCTQAGYMHHLNGTTRLQTMCMCYLVPAQQSPLPWHTLSLPAARPTTSACRMHRRIVQAAAAAGHSKPTKIVKSQDSGDNPLALAFLGDAIWSVSNSLG